MVKNSIFLQEQKRYTKKQLIELFHLSENKSVNLIRKLKEYNIIKMVQATDEQKKLSDLLESDIEIAAIETNNSHYYYVATFVGIIIINDIVLGIYPKYFVNENNIIPRFKKIIKVLEKYSKSEEEILKIVNDTNEQSFFNLLALELFLLKDYFENGTYLSSANSVEINGYGEILWGKTVNETFALISKNRPYYTELKTQKTINNNFCYIKRLYECVLTTVSKELEENGLADIFDIPILKLSEEKITDFGSIDYILYKIEQELNVEFNTRKQIILKLLYAYIRNLSYDDTIGFDISLFGTNNFNLVWEDVCKKTLNNMLNKPLKNILDNLSDKYENYRTLKDIIASPKWSEAEKAKLKTFEPDLITIKEDKFIILDAKYYCPKFSPEKISGQPGIESITKQYMYQLAFKEFIEEHGFDVKNCFLFPADNVSEFDENNYCYHKGNVILEMLDNLNIGLAPIEAKFLQASKMYDYYLNNNIKLDFDKINI